MENNIGNEQENNFEADLSDYEINIKLLAEIRTELAQALFAAVHPPGFVEKVLFKFRPFKEVILDDCAAGANLLLSNLYFGFEDTIQKSAVNKKSTDNVFIKWLNSGADQATAELKELVLFEFNSSLMDWMSLDEIFLTFCNFFHEKMNTEKEWRFSVDRSVKIDRGSNQFVIFLCKCSL